MMFEPMACVVAFSPESRGNFLLLRRKPEHPFCCWLMDILDELSMRSTDGRLRLTAERRPKGWKILSAIVMRNGEGAARSWFHSDFFPDAGLSELFPERSFVLEAAF